MIFVAVYWLHMGPHCGACRRSRHSPWSVGIWIADQIGQLNKELDMMTSLQILFGLSVGFMGFHIIGESPLPGCSALFIAGFLILAGIDRLSQLKE
jgi:hypothetical protein